jgi:hypothetical protein
MLIQVQRFSNNYARNLACVYNLSNTGVAKTSHVGSNAN